MGGLRGITHSKALWLVYPPRASHAAALLSGSANWTTSSRGNHEVGTYVVFPSGVPQVSEVSAWVEGLWANGEDLSVAAQTAAHRSKSAGREF